MSRCQNSNLIRNELFARYFGLSLVRYRRQKLSTPAKRVLEESSDDFYLSLASIWELAIKSNLCRGLELPRPFAEFVDIELQAERIQILNIEVAHLKQVAALPLHHRDPFDRLLIAQSQVENIPVITSDSTFDQYAIQRFW